MSRFTLICSLVVGLSSTALVQPAAAQFAKAPPAAAQDSIGMSDMELPPVETQLRVAPRPTLDRATVRAALAKARAANLASFRAYQANGVFPSNTFKAGALNVWLDADGHFCAAATIIKMSGQDELVTKVAEQNNFIRLADVKQGPVMDWILTSGFTQDELALIQRPFMPVTRRPSLVEPALVDAKLRKAEDARLRAKYKAIDKQLVKLERKSLEKAVDRLMKNQTLAWSLVSSQS